MVDRYYVAATQPSRERYARDRLEAQAFSVFLPECVEVIRHAHKVTKRRAPLFPGYLFVQVDVERARWRAINGTPGVVCLLSAGDYPSPVPEGIVEEIAARCDLAGGAIKMPDPYDVPFRRDEPVRVKTGPFAGFSGVFVAASRDRVRLLLDILGGSVVVQFPLQCVEPAGSAD